MTGLDTRYIPSKFFQEAILDKDTGEPLVAGVVKFFEDEDRVEPKEVFELTGTPPNYIYTSLGTEITLSGVGTFQDGFGNDIIPYLFPFDADGNIQLYFATIESSGAVFQFSREGFPNVSQDEQEDEELKNFVPNGQFLLHHDIVVDENGSIEAGEITEDVVDIAEGGWTFERTSASTAKDFVLFERLGSFVLTPSKSPRYALRVKNESPGVADVFKDIRIKFRDVNKFADAEQKFTIAFQAKSNTGSTSLLDVKLIKNYGTGGSPEETTTLQSLTLTTDYVLHDIPFVFGSNDGKTIGNNDDDFVQLALSLPVSNVFDDSFDNIMLVKTDKQIDEFPDTTDAEFIRDSLAGWPPVPNYEGENLYLPLILGPEGFDYDDSAIGRYVWKSFTGAGKGELLCDGSKFRVDSYSSDKIPYKRLYNKWATISDVGLSPYGTGDDEMRMVKSATVDQSFTDEVSDLTGTDDWQSFTAGTTGVLRAITIKIGGTAPTINSIKIYDGEGITGTLLSTNSNLTFVVGENTVFLDTPFFQEITQLYTIRIESNTTLTWKGNVAGGYADGKYNGGASDAYFKNLIDIGTLVPVYLKSNTAGAVTSAADGSSPTGFTFLDITPDPYVVSITTVAGSSVPAGSFWTYNTTDSRKYINWYTVDGAGTKPVEIAAIYIKVDISSTDTDAVVSTKTAKAINGYSIRIPDWKGYFPRVTDDVGDVDPDKDKRLSWDTEFVGDFVGTMQQEEIGPHTHPVTPNAGLLAVAGAFTHTGGGFSDSGIEVLVNDGDENRPINFYTTLYVKY